MAGVAAWLEADAPADAPAGTEVSIVYSMVAASAASAMEYAMRTAPVPASAPAGAATSSQAAAPATAPCPQHRPGIPPSFAHTTSPSCYGCQQGDVVWAKLGGDPWWPAAVSNCLCFDALTITVQSLQCTGCGVHVLHQVLHYMAHSCCLQNVVAATCCSA